MRHRSAILALVCVLLVTVASTRCWRDTAENRDSECERILQERAAQDETAIRAAPADNRDTAGKPLMARTEAD